MSFARAVEQVAEKLAERLVQSVEGDGALDDVMQPLQHHLLQSPLAEPAPLADGPRL